MELLTTEQAAARLPNSNPQLVRLWIREGRIPGAVKHGRDWLIPSTALDQIRWPNPLNDPRRKYAKIIA